MHLLFLASLSLGWLDDLAHDPRHVRQHGADLFAVYSAGSNLRGGVSIYSPPEDPQIPYRYAFRYSPLAALLIGMPLSLLRPLAAYALWVGFLEALLAWFVVALWRRGRGRRAVYPAIALTLAFYPYYLELYIGQYSWLQAVLFFATCIGLAQRKTLSAGLAFAASLAWKGNTLLLLPALWRGRRTRLALLCLAAVVLFCAPYFAMHPQTLAEFGRNFASDYPAGFTRGNLGMQRLADRALDQFGTPVLDEQNHAQQEIGVGHYVSPEHRGRTLSALAAAVAALTLLITLRSRPERIVELCCLWMASYFLVYKHVWEHQYVMLLPVLALLALQRPSKLLWLSWIWLALPTPYALLEPAIVNQQPLELCYYAFKVLPAALVWGLCAAWSLRR